MCDCDVETSTVWDRKDPRAKKPHRCDWCLTMIDVGAVYCRIGSLFDGSWSTWRLHAECAAACDRGDEWCCIVSDNHHERGRTEQESYDARRPTDGL